MDNHTPTFPKNITDYAPWVAESGLLYPYGICQCGCGQPTSIAKASRKVDHSRKGEFLRFRSIHSLQAPWYESLEDYFWTYCTPGPFTDCWVWQGSISSTGYGAIHYGGRQYTAHRVSWEILNEQPFPKGKVGCHECDNRPCVNPYHIWPGTRRDNTADMVAKRRHAFGERHSRAKLTEEQIREIRDLHQQGHASNEISQSYDVDGSTISSIITYRTWKHVREVVDIYHANAHDIN